MTEEEIIEQIKNDLNVGEFYGITEDAIEGLLDLYNKKQEEIKELKEITKEYDSYIGEKMPLDSKIIIADREYFINGTFVNNYISKDKIRDKIKELEKSNKHYVDMISGKEIRSLDDDKIDLLKELLEE